MNSISDAIGMAGLGLTLMISIAAAPFVTDAIATVYERYFGPIHDHDDDLHA